jgi:hypothetical protein
MNLRVGLYGGCRKARSLNVNFMKTQMSRMWVLGVAIVGLALGAGCQEDQARAQVPDIDKLVPELAPTASTTAVEPAATPLDVAAADLEKAAASTNAPMPRLVAKPVMPENLKASPALEEVLKLAQAGVSEEVIMAYIVHSTNFFNVGSDAIVYLNDLGVANNVITALIHHDTTPEMQARHQIATAVQPLPANIALNTPATNVYPPAVPQTGPAPAVDTTAAPPPPDTPVTTVGVPEEPANVSYFYSSLAPYGTWVEIDDYGLCWQPTVVVSNPRWRPYCDSGRWIWSNHGWYWYSDYSWGWAPFHYGRWCDYPRLGWVWVPDTYWGPSWVSWRYSSSYCGWAPLPPACYYRPGFGFSYYGSSYGFSFGFDFGLSYHHYSYIPVNRFCDRSPGLHVVRGDRALAVHRNTTVVNNYIVGDNNTIINNGVGRDRIAAVTRGQVPTATVREGTTRGSTRREQIVNEGSSLAIVRPTLPPKPERSHVAVPNRAGITRISSDNNVALNSSSGANAVTRPNSPGLIGRTAPSSALNRERAASVRSGETTPSSGSQPGATVDASRTAPSSAVNRQPVPSTARSTEVTTSSESRPSANNREARSSVFTPPRTRAAESESVTRPNTPGFRSYARPGATRSENTPQVAVNNAPAPAPSVSRPQSSAPPVSRPEVSAPVATAPAPAPSISRPSTPATPAPRATVPNNPGVRNYSNPGANSRPNTPSAPPPQVSRPSPSVSAPAPAQSRPSYSAPATRPEPSRPAQSAPSYSAPSRSTPSYSPPPSSRSSSPSYSAPSRGNSQGFGGGRSEGRGRGRD